MVDPVDRLLREALGLSADDRVRLAAELLATLELDVPAGPGGEDGWIREIPRWTPKTGQSWTPENRPVR
jgi:hypothetical protein